MAADAAVTLATALACIGMVFDDQYYHYAIVAAVVLNAVSSATSLINPPTKGLRAILWTMNVALWAVTIMWQLAVIISLMIVWFTCKKKSMCDPGVLCTGPACGFLNATQLYADVAMPSNQFIAVFSLVGIGLITEILCAIMSIVVCVIYWRLASSP